jgi:hypothetical protein
MNGIITHDEGSDALYTGQVTATTSAAALGSQACNGVAVQNDPGSSVNVLVGNATNQYIALVPGDNAVIPCTNISQVYVKSASSTATVNWLARS